MYDYPGLPSLTIAYFDTNDFYFSGHIGSCTIYTMEFIAVGNWKLAIFGILVTCNQWIFLTFFRSHYDIDMITAVPVAIMCHRIGELGAYLIDVIIFQLQFPRRENFWFKPCRRCGWLVDCPEKLTS